MRVWGVLVHLACYTVGWVYPAFRSFESLESKSTLDDSQWLTYWVLLAVYSICEAICWRGLRLLPFYNELKLAILCWLSLPFTNGATWVYFQGRPHILKVVSWVRTQMNYLTGKAEAVSVKDISSSVDGDMLEVLQGKMAAYKAKIEADLSADYEAVVAGRAEPSALSHKVDKLESSLRKKPISKTGGTKETYEQSPNEPEMPVSGAADPQPQAA